jgi:hypothetical protein
VAGDAPAARPYSALLGGVARAVLVAVTFALAGLAICWPLGLTNRILAGVDAFTYFTPYWAYRAAALQAGDLPLWNPYLFTGVPFLANPQAAVLYPPHWPLNWLPPAQALVWSALTHVWLAALLMYAFARRSLKLHGPAAWLAGALFGFGGFALARIENINQLNALAWLPALLWLYDETRDAGGWRARVRWGSAFAAVITVQLLAGHTQTTFINTVGLGLYAGWHAVSAFRSHSPTRVFPPLLPLLAVLPALLLSAAQLLPTLELNGLGLRTGGMAYRLAVSFSLRPRLLLQTLLPPFGGGLAEAFGSEGYAEFMAAIGVTGLILAALGIRSLARRGGVVTGPHCRSRRAAIGLIVLAAAGCLLALGAYNPLYYLLWRFVPGFDLFRAPARWLALYGVAVAGLAGVGLDAWLNDGRLTTDDRRRTTDDGRPTLDSCFRRNDMRQGAAPRASSHLRRQVSRLWDDLHRNDRRRNDMRQGAAPRVSSHLRRQVSGVLGALRKRDRWLWVGLGLALGALLAFQQLPDGRTVLGWAAAGLYAAALLWQGARWPRLASVGLIALCLAELWLGSRALPFTLATTPAALGLRNAPAALLAATDSQPPAGRDRFLSMSDIRYDPGDLAELRTLQDDRLSVEATERYIRAAKWHEVIAPNLSALWRLPAIDGYDGGLLPTADYGKLLALFLPPDERLSDGRLREQLRTLPPDRLLDLTGVRYVITDKQHDLWAGDVYYDLEQPVPMQAGQTLTLDLAGYPAFSATALGVVAEPGAANAPDRGNATPPSGLGGSRPSTGLTSGERVARTEIVIQAADGAMRLPLSAAAAQPVTLVLPMPMIPATLTVRVGDDAPSGLTLRGLSLIDQRTGAHQSVTLSARGDLRRIHSGDVKIYERTAAAGRAWLVHGVQPAADEAEALRLLADPAFDPRSSAVVDGASVASPTRGADPGERVAITSAEPERITLRAEVGSPALLVLADAFYPGWQATVDGTPAPILRANLMFRAIALDPGTHEVVFSYRPLAVRVGAAISLAALILLMLGMLTTFIPATMPPNRTAV